MLLRSSFSFLVYNVRDRFAYSPADRSLISLSFRASSTSFCFLWKANWSSADFFSIWRVSVCLRSWRSCSLNNCSCFSREFRFFSYSSRRSRTMSWLRFANTNLYSFRYPDVFASSSLSWMLSVSICSIFLWKSFNRGWLALCWTSVFSNDFIRSLISSC